MADPKLPPGYVWVANGNRWMGGGAVGMFAKVAWDHFASLTGITKEKWEAMGHACEWMRKAAPLLGRHVSAMNGAEDQQLMALVDDAPSILAALENEHG